jgi:hypothetical protein
MSPNSEQKNIGFRNKVCSGFKMCRLCLKKDHRRRKRFWRYVGGDWTFAYLLRRANKIFMKLTLNWQSEKLNKLNGALRILSVAVGSAMFDALSVWTSSKSQLLH